MCVGGGGKVCMTWRQVKKRGGQRFMLNVLCRVYYPSTIENGCCVVRPMHSIGRVMCIGRVVCIGRKLCVLVA